MPKKQCLKNTFLLVAFVFLAATLYGCGSNVYQGLDSKSSADLKLCLDYGDYDCVLSNLNGETIKSEPALNVMYAEAELQKASFNLFTIMSNSLNYDFKNPQISTMTNLYELAAQPVKIDVSLLSDAAKRLNDANPTASDTQIATGVANLLNAVTSIYSTYDSDGNGKLEPADTALQNATTAASTWNNTLKGSASSYNSGVLGNIQAAVDFIKLSYTGSKTGNCPSDSKTCSKLTDAGNGVKDQFTNTTKPTDADTLNAILCMDKGKTSDNQTNCP